MDIGQLRDIAKKFSTRGAFKKGHSYAYKCAHKLHILDEICSHMPKRVDMAGKNSPSFKWTNEMLQQEALKYKTRGEFKKNNAGAYSASCARGILNGICSHMPKDSKVGKRSHNFKWTPEKLRQEALKYETRGEFKQGGHAYSASILSGILDDVCAHMPKHVDQSGENHPNFKWTLEMLQQEALKYKTRGEFCKDSLAYDIAHKRGILDQICSHMEEVKLPWTLEELQQEALKYKTRGEFRKNSLGAYIAAHKRGTIDQICSHTGESSNLPYTLEELQEEALKYKTRGEFKQNNSAYGVALRRGVLDEVCSHMPKHVDQCGENSPSFKWTNEKLQEEALRYKTRGEFARQNGGAYGTAQGRTLLDTICSHMIVLGGESLSEQDLFKFIKSKYPKTTKLRDRKVNIPGKPHIKGFDVDMYIPELRKGIEFDGQYWHSIEGLKRSREHWPEEDVENYHKLKDEHFRSKGIELLHINEKDWLSDKQQSLDRVLEFLEG